MEVLTGMIQHYAWGSHRAIASLQGRATPTADPEAELWLGAHPSLPSTVRRADGTAAVSDLIADQAQWWLGEQVRARFGARLPFLVKVLAAEQPLSLQVHPEAGHAASRWTQSHPGYVDAHHKPELLVALEPFDVLCGFRDLPDSAAALRAFGVTVLDEAADLLTRGALKFAVRVLLQTRGEPAAHAIGQALHARVPDWFAADQDLVRLLAARYPADPAVLVSLLLHRRMLAAGEAIWMPAGNLHAYLRGTGIEVMAASDNVLRAGLTAKPVDVPEVLRVLRYEVLADPVLHARPCGPGVRVWDVPVEDFGLWAVDVAEGETPVGLRLPGPKIVVSTGDVWVADDDGRVALGPGQAALGRADAGECTIGGSGRVFVASTALIAQPAAMTPA